MRRAAECGEEEWDTVGDSEEVRVEAVESVEAASFSDAVGGGEADLEDSDEVDGEGDAPFCVCALGVPSAARALSEEEGRKRMRGTPCNEVLIDDDGRGRWTADDDDGQLANAEDDTAEKREGAADGALGAATLDPGDRLDS